MGIWHLPMMHHHRRTQTRKWPKLIWRKTRNICEVSCYSPPCLGSTRNSFGKCGISWRFECISTVHELAMGSGSVCCMIRKWGESLWPERAIKRHQFPPDLHRMWEHSSTGQVGSQREKIWVVVTFLELVAFRLRLWDEIRHTTHLLSKTASRLFRRHGHIRGRPVKRHTERHCISVSRFQRNKPFAAGFLVFSHDVRWFRVFVFLRNLEDKCWRKPQAKFCISLVFCSLHQTFSRRIGPIVLPQSERPKRSSGRNQKCRSKPGKLCLAGKKGSFPRKQRLSKSEMIVFFCAYMYIRKLAARKHYPL